MIANLKHAGNCGVTITVGGGRFEPTEIKSFTAVIEHMALALENMIEFPSHKWAQRQAQHVLNQYKEICK